jgi:hypothetical protein
MWIIVDSCPHNSGIRVHIRGLEGPVQDDVCFLECGKEIKLTRLIQWRTEKAVLGDKTVVGWALAKTQIRTT